MENPTDKLEKMLRVTFYNMHHDLEIGPKICLKLIRELVSSGADLSIIEQRGTHCIPYVFSDVKLIKFFLNNGISDLDARDRDGNTALIYAAFHELKDSVRFLLDHSADPNIRNLEGETALHRLVASKQQSRFKRSAIAKMLIEHGADVNARTEEGLTILHQNGFNPKVFGFLLDKFENVDVRTNHENTPLMEAACRGDTELCRLLIKRNADVNAKNSEGFTPLHYAVYSSSYKCRKCVKLLVSSGSNPNIKSDSGMDAYTMYRSCVLVDEIVGRIRLQKLSIAKYLEDPIRKIDALEMEGAWFLLFHNYSRDQPGLNLWEKALEMRLVLNLPKPEPSLRQKEIYKIQDYFRTKPEMDNLRYDGIHRQALLIFDRISKGSNWYLLRGICYLLISQINFELACEMLKYLEATMDPKEMETMDQFNRDTINEIIISLYMNVRLRDLRLRVVRDLPLPDVLMLPDDRLSFVVKIYISALKNGCKNVSTFSFFENLKVAFFLCYYILSMDEISETRKDFIKEIINLGLRNANGDTLLHLACIGSHENISVRMARVLVSCGADVTILNGKGQESIQFIDASSEDADTIDLVVKMAEKGAHLDAKSFSHLPTKDPQTYHSPELLLKRNGVNTVPYVSLKCLAARVLARSCVHYKRVLPERLTEFVNSHHSPC